MDDNSRRSFFSNPYFLLLSFFAVGGLIFRFIGLESAPPGLFVDEQAGIANVLCLTRNGTSLYGKSWPLYFQALGGFYDPIFIYTQAVFAKLFGVSIASFRIFPSICLLSACIGTAAVAYLVYGLEAALLTFVISLFCPWSFHAGRLVWGSGLITAFIPWGVFFLLRIGLRENSVGTNYRSAAIAGLCFACAASLYRPANAVVVLILAYFFITRIPPLKIRFRYLFTSVAVVVAGGIPNIIFLAGSGWNRVDNLSILGTEHMAKLNGSYVEAAKEILENFGLLLSPRFLFVSGDAIYRHTPAWGPLGWPECCGLLCLGLFLIAAAVRPRQQRIFNRKELAFLLFSCVGVIIGLTPAAQSWDSNPHALRANAAWPFFVLLASVGMLKLFRHLSVGPLVNCLVISMYVPIFLSHYFLVFPALASPWFDGPLTRSSKQGAASGDWSEFKLIVQDYGRDGPVAFPMMYLNLDCPAAINFIETLKQAPSTEPPRITIDFGEPAPLFLGGSSTSLAPRP